MTSHAGSLIASLFTASVVAACSGQPTPPETAPQSRPESTADSPRRRLEDAPVYDAKGQAHACDRPQQECTSPTADRDFLDKCRLAGFTVRQCGCETFCAGKVETQALHYAESGKASPCAPVQNECTPPEASARFQDACADAGHKLLVCGCEWRCAGKPREGAPPMQE